jgi:hypothetical protein
MITCLLLQCRMSNGWRAGSSAIYIYTEVEEEVFSVPNKGHDAETNTTDLAAAPVSSVRRKAGRGTAQSITARRLPCGRHEHQHHRRSIDRDRSVPSRA